MPEMTVQFLIRFLLLVKNRSKIFLPLVGEVTVWKSQSPFIVLENSWLNLIKVSETRGAAGIIAIITYSIKEP